MKNTTKITIKEAEERLQFTNSYTRLGAVLGLRPKMRPHAWLRLLGRHWSTCDNIADHFAELRLVFDGMSAVAQMMTGREWREYQLLPDVVTVYRGCGSSNRSGWSWSLDENVASTFPFLSRYCVATPILVTAIAPKGRIIALKHDRDESEIITGNVEITNVESISAERGRSLLELHAQKSRQQMRAFLKPKSARSRHGSQQPELGFASGSSRVGSRQQGIA